MINLLIADDEAHARQRLVTLLEEYPGFKIVKLVDNGDDLVPALVGQSVDVAFLDINMPGLEVFESLSALKSLPLIVFQTAYSEHAVRAFEVQALDYIMKPVSRERFAACISKIKKALIRDDRLPFTEPEISQHRAQNIEQISVKTGQKVKVIKIDEIIKIEVENGLSFIYTPDGRWLSDSSLNYFESIFSPDKFFRISRSAIVNLSSVKHLHPMFNGNYVVELENRMKLPVSRRRMKALRQKINFV